MEYPLNIYITAHTLISSLGFGISENKKVKVFNKTNEKELFFKNMDECFEYISQENKRQMELDT